METRMKRMQTLVLVLAIVSLVMTIGLCSKIRSLKNELAVKQVEFQCSTIDKRKYAEETEKTNAILRKVFGSAEKEVKEK